MKKEYTIKDLVYLMLGRIWWIIGAALICGLAAFLISDFAIPRKYQSNVSMYVRNKEDQKQDINNSDLSVSKSLVSTYIVILNNDAVMEQVGEQLLKQHTPEELSGNFTIKNGKITNESLKSAFTMAAVNNTEVLKITATTKNAALSAELCNIMADVAPEVLIRVVGAGSVEKIGNAKIYEAAVSPSVTKNTAIGFAGGALLAILVILLIDFFDNTVRDTEELRKHFSKPIIAEIQSIGGKAKKKNRGTDADRKTRLLFGNENIPFSTVEAYKSFRTALSFVISTCDSRIVAMTSANPSEGKSVTVANLAVAVAQTDKKVLLIDADMRKPVQHKCFRLSNKVGLSDVITGDKPLDKALNRNVTGSLDVLTSGTIPPNPSELLASRQMKELLETLKERYDMILIDCAPINVVSDVAGLSQEIAGVVMVVHYGFTTYPELDDAVNRLALANCNVLGFAVNEVSSKHGSGYYSNYKYKYKYKYDYQYGSAKQAEEKEKAGSAC